MTRHPSTSIEIVAHCYDPPGSSQYAEMARVQFASLYNFRPSWPVVYSLCYSPDNLPAQQTIDWIRGFYEREGTIYNLATKTVSLGEPDLFRRAIGRNFCAKRTISDVVWFTDIDYVFGPGAIDAACGQTTPDTELVTPAEYQIHRDHETGDDDLRAMRGAALPLVEPSHFVPRKGKTAIGGLQIVGGNTARRVGYLDGTKWVQPVDAAAGFRSCRCDRAFRKHNGFSTEYLTIPNVYRLRHTQDGRDRDQTGTVRGKEVW